MAKLKIDIIELVAATEQKNDIIDYLQRRGVLELSIPTDTDGMTLKEYTRDQNEAEANIRALNEAVHILSLYCPNKKPLTAMLEPRKDMTSEEFSERAKSIPDIMKSCNEIISADKKIGDMSSDNVRFKTLIDSLTPWKNVDVVLKEGKTEKTAYFFGSIKGDVDREYVLSLLAKSLPENDRVEIEIVSADELQTNIAVYCMKTEAADVENALRSAGFVRAPVCDTTVGEAIDSYENKIADNIKNAAEIKEELSSKHSLYDDFEFALDYFSVRKDKFRAFGNIPESSRIFYVRGYIAERDTKRTLKYIDEHFDAAVEISEPSEDEDVPVLLSNNAFSAPLENITGMYSMPSKGDIDPTGVMAFFYYFFFGMMLSDAGYGMIIALATGALLLFKRNMERPLRNTIKMYFFCGLSTVFWGAMYGSWFGDAASVIAQNFFGKSSDYTPAFFKPIWTDAVSDLMNVLIVCFIMGLVHLFTGVVLKGVTDLKNGHKFDAFCDTVPTFLAVIGMAPIFFSLFLQDTIPDDYTALGTFIFNAVKTVHSGLSKVNIPILIVGLVLIVLTSGRDAKTIGGKIGGGLYAVYNTFGGYLGDVLSYARLLALGLATGVIANVMNMLGTLPKNNVLKLIMFIVVFIVGHIANLAINVIGAYVHTNRLQYVEFFGKFYEGGGRAFVPLAANTKSYKITEEN